MGDYTIHYPMKEGEKMTKGKTKAGHIFYKTTSAECAKWGGVGICDTCNEHHDEGYIVPGAERVALPGVL